MQAMANARELLKTYLSIKNELNSAEVRDPANKKTYPIAPFLKMGNYHIPTNVDMSNGNGLNRRDWKVNHVFGTAKCYTDTAGFPNGKLSCHEEWCEFRQDSCTVHVSVFGDIIQFDDPSMV